MLAYDCVVITPTRNRPGVLAKKIALLAESAKMARINVCHLVFDDCSEDKYKYKQRLVELEKPYYKIIYHRMPTRYGRRGLATLYTKMFQEVKKLNFRYIMSTSDDSLPCNNFFLRVIQHFELHRYKDVSIVGMNLCWHPGKMMWGIMRYTDSGFFATRELLDAVEWKIVPPTEGWLVEKQRSSGVGVRLTRVLKAHERYNLAPWDGNSFMLVNEWGIRSQLFDGNPKMGKSTEARDKLFVDYPGHRMVLKKGPALLPEPPKEKKKVKPKDPGIVLTVILPMFRAKYIGWLPFESLIAQEGVKFKWELLIAEEVKEEPFGAEEILKYKQRLENVGCVNLRYIGIQEWIPLAKKWLMLAKMAAKTSEIICGHPADYYAAPAKLARHKEVFSNPDVVWHQPRRAIHYLIKTGGMVLQDTTKAKRQDNVVGKAMRPKFIRDFPDSTKRSGIDGWMFKRYRAAVIKSGAKFKTFPEVAGEDWRYALSTVGFNNISPKGRLPTIGKGLIFTEYREDLRQYIPPFVMDKLEASREFLPKHARKLPQNRQGG